MAVKHAKKGVPSLPRETVHSRKTKIFEELNEIVNREYISKTPGSSKKRKRGEYVHYTP